MYKVAFKYWLFHKKELFSILFTIAVSMASIMSCTFLIRGMFVKHYETVLDNGGSYDFIFLEVDDTDCKTIRNSGFFEKGGRLKIYGEIEGVSDRAYTAGSVDAQGQELYHHSCQSGRYPENIQEIAATKECLEALGVEPELGAKAHLIINCADGAVYESDFTVSGILCDLVQERYLFECPEIQLPEMFFYNLDASAVNYFITIETVQYTAEDVFSFADENNLQCLYTAHFTGAQSVFLPAGGESTRQNQEFLMQYIQKDFNSAVLVPVLSIIIALLSGISIYAALSSSYRERKKSLDMIRCIGLTKKKMFIQIAMENFLLSGAGILLGYGLGILCYVGILLVQKELFGLRIYPAFKVVDIVSHATANPYTYPLAICMECVICICILLLVHMHAVTDKFVFLPQQENSVCFKICHRRNSFQVHADRVWKKVKRVNSVTTGRRILHKCFAGNISSRVFLSILMICIISVGSFCCLYFAECYQDKVEKMLSDEEMNDADFDYAAYKDFSKSNVLTLGANRHHGGITPEDIKRLEESTGITDMRYAVESKSTKILIKVNGDGISKDRELKKFLKGNEIKASMSYLGELDKKTKEYFGYGGYHLYGIPTVGVSKSQLQSLESHIISGSVNWDALRQGKEVILIQYGESECPYRVGDTIQMTDVVQENEEYEKFDFSGGMLPKNVKPAFTWHSLNEDNQPEGEELDGYVFGKRKDYEVSVGAVMEIEADSADNFYCTASKSGNNAIQFLCSIEAFAAWGLRDRNITKVKVSLDNPSKRKEFSKLWYEILGNSTDMAGTSSIARTEKKKNIFVDYISIIIAIVAVLLLCSVLGCYHLIQRELLYKEETLKKLGELGMSRKRICLHALKENLKYPLVGILLGWLPVAAFDWIGDAIRRSLGSVVSITGRTPWYLIYPYTIQTLNRSTLPVLLTAFVITGVLVAYMVVHTMKKLLK